MPGQSDKGKLKARILKMLKQRAQSGTGTAILRRPQINNLIGRSKIKAGQLEDILREMEVDQLIDYHWRTWESPEFIGGVYWALWNHPDNVSARESKERTLKEMDEIHIFHEQQRLKWELENAPRLAREKFDKDLALFLHNNYDELFMLFRRIHAFFRVKDLWLNSRPTTFSSGRHDLN